MQRSMTMGEWLQMWGRTCRMASPTTLYTNQPGRRPGLRLRGQGEVSAIGAAVASAGFEEDPFLS